MAEWWLAAPSKWVPHRKRLVARLRSFYDDSGCQLIKEHRQKLHEDLQAAGFAEYSKGGSGFSEREARHGIASKAIRVKVRC